MPINSFCTRNTDRECEIPFLNFVIRLNFWCKIVFIINFVWDIVSARDSRKLRTVCSLQALRPSRSCVKTNWKPVIEYAQWELCQYFKFKYQMEVGTERVNIYFIRHVISISVPILYNNLFLNETMFICVLYYYAGRYY